MSCAPGSVSESQSLRSMSPAAVTLTRIDSGSNLTSWESNNHMIAARFTLRSVKSPEEAKGLRGKGIQVVCLTFALGGASNLGNNPHE